MKPTPWIAGAALLLALPLCLVLFAQSEAPSSAPAAPQSGTALLHPAQDPEPAAPPPSLALTNEPAPTPAPTAPVMSIIAVVQDGDDPRTESFLQQITAELAPLLGGPGAWQFDSRPAFRGSWTPDSCRRALEAALQDPAITHILVTGPGGLAAALRLDPLPKPVVSSTLLRVDIGSEWLTEDGRSARENLIAPVLPGALRQDLLAFHELVPFDRVHLALPQKALNTIPDPTALLRRLTEGLPFDVALLPLGDSVPAALDSVAVSGARALVLTNALAWPDAEHQRFIDGLNTLKIPTFSARGTGDVLMGALATSNPELAGRLARRTAINLYQILQGTPATEIQVLFPVNRRLQLNAATAAAIGFHLPFAALDGADLIHPEALYRGEALDFDSLLKIADQKNLRNLIAAAEAAVSEASKNRARSRLLPQAGLQTQFAAKDSNHARFTAAPSQAWTAGASIRQVIFDDKTLTDYLAGIDRHHSAKFEEQSVRLDIQAAAGTAFINLLAAEALVRVERANLQLTRAHLEAARIRVQAGATSPEDVLRWEAQEATGLAALASRTADANSARAVVNQIRSVPVETLFTAADIDLPPDDMAFARNALLEAVRDFRSMRRFHAFTILRALEGSPEVQSIDSLVSATRKDLGQSRRAFYLPSVSAQLDYFRELDDRGPTFQRPAGLEQDNWQAVLRAELPLFTGGGRLAEASRQKALLDSIIGQRDLAAQLVSRRALTAVFSLEGSWRSLRFTRTARDRSERNLQIVQDKYTQGDADITHLIDAQRALFDAEQQAALAKYTYLADLVEYQRSIAWFQANRPPEDIDAFVTDLLSVMNPAPTPP